MYWSLSIYFTFTIQRDMICHDFFGGVLRVLGASDDLFLFVRAMYSGVRVVVWGDCGWRLLFWFFLGGVAG